MQELNNGDTLPETLLVQNYGLAEWLKDVEQAIHNGYEFDFDSNEAYPQTIGHVHTCIMKLRKPNLNWLPQTLQQTEPVLDFPPIVEPVVEKDVLPVKQAETPSVLAFSEAGDVLGITPFALLPDEQKLVGEQPSNSIVAKEETVVAKPETSEVDQPAKRGPKPKNK